MQQNEAQTEAQNGTQVVRKNGYWKGALAEIKRVRTLAGAGMLAALGIALRGAVIPLSQTHRISFTSFPIAIAGFMYGPFVGGLVGLVMDMLGYFLNPTGPYFPGFAFNAFLNGFIYGLWLYRHEVRLWRVACAVLTSTLVISFYLNPLMLQFLYNIPYWATVAERLVTNAVLIPTYTALIYTVCKVLAKQKGLMNRPRHT